MPKIAAKISSTNDATQAMTTGLAAPSIVWQPGGTRAFNVYPAENLLQNACTDATVGMNGPFPVYLDLSLNSDAYTAGGDLNLGAATRFVCRPVVDSTYASPPRGCPSFCHCATPF